MWLHKPIPFLIVFEERSIIAKNESLVDLSGANFSKIGLFHAAMIEADLSETTLIEANLGGTFLQGTNFERANLTRAVLSMSSAGSEKLLCNEMET